jgi:hypothetical protein
MLKIHSNKEGIHPAYPTSLPGTIIFYFVLFFNLVPSVNFFSQEENYPTAQEKISEVNVAVLAVAPDAKLLSVVGTGVTLQGESHRWIYIFVTPNRKMFEYWYEDNELKKRSSISQWEDYKPNRKMHPVEEDWMDSDDALNIANANGGNTFIGANGNQIEIDMRLMPPAVGSGVGFFSLYPQSVWHLQYRFEENNLSILINAVSGEVLNYNKTTAKELYQFVDTIAQRVASDAQIIYVKGYNVDTTGRTGEWYYQYQSIANSSTFEFRLGNGRIGLNFDHTTSPYHVFTSSNEIPDAWFDSDSTIIIAENNGGREFRKSHSNWKIDATLWVSEKRYAQWQFAYRSEPSMEFFRVDAVQINGVTASEHAQMAQTFAENLAQDAELILVNSRTVDEIGRAPGYQKVYQIYGSDGRVIQEQLAQHYIEEILLYNLPIDDIWIDSDSALLISEDKGGEQFRMEHKDVEIHLNLGVTEIGHAQWEVQYSATPYVEFYYIDAQNVEKTLARTFFATVDSIAKNIASDAKLIFVYTGFSDENGKAGRWNYFYKSFAKNELMQFFTTKKKIYKNHEIAGPVTSQALLEFTPIPDFWIDSDLAVSEAEKDGGKNYRENNVDWYIEAFLQWDDYSEQANWRIVYYPAGQSYEIKAHNYDEITAHEIWDKIDSFANQISSDGKLIFIVSDDVETGGKSSQWHYIFEMGDKKTFEIRTLGKNLFQPLYPKFPNNNPGSKAFPDLWFDSDLALAKAEEMGGKEFMNTHENVNITMNLHAFSQKSGLGNSEYLEGIWNIYYNAPTGGNRQYAVPTFSKFVNIGWPKYYGGSQNDYGKSIQETTDRGYIIAGYTESYGKGMNDTWLLKVDSSGNELWNKAYGGADNDYGQFVENGEGDDFIIAQNTASSPSIFKSSIIRTDLNGNNELEYAFGGESYNYFNCIRFTSDSSYLLVGSIDSVGEGKNDIWLLKVNLDGEEIWSNTIGGNGNDVGEFIWETDDQGFIIVGTTDSEGAGGNDIWLRKTDKNGEVEWKKTFGGSNDEIGKSIYITADGGYIIVGSKEIEGQGMNDIYIIKTDSNGNLDWEKTFGGMDDDYGNMVQQTPDGGYIVVGTTQSYGAGDKDIWILKLDNFGVEEWNKTVGGPWTDLGEALCQTKNGYFVVVGSSNSLGNGNFDIIVTKLDNEGVFTHNVVPIKKQSRLFQNFPNPFSQRTTIRFILESPEKVKLRIINMIGQEIIVLLNEDLQAGEYYISWDGMAPNGNYLPAGIYLFELSAGSEKDIKKSIIFK